MPVGHMDRVKISFPFFLRINPSVFFKDQTISLSLFCITLQILCFLSENSGKICCQFLTTVIRGISVVCKKGGIGDIHLALESVARLKWMDSCSLKFKLSRNAFCIWAAKNILMTATWQLIGRDFYFQCCYPTVIQGFFPMRSLEILFCTHIFKKLVDMLHFCLSEVRKGHPSFRVHFCFYLVLPLRSSNMYLVVYLF